MKAAKGRSNARVLVCSFVKWLVLDMMCLFRDAAQMHQYSDNTTDCYINLHELHESSSLVVVE
eukprot:2810167-Amphidinium_carterae.1